MLPKLLHRNYHVFLMYYWGVTKCNLGICLLFFLTALIDPKTGVNLGLFIFCFVGYPVVVYLLYRLRPQELFFYYNFNYTKWQLWGMGAVLNLLLATCILLLRGKLLPLLWQS